MDTLFLLLHAGCCSALAYATALLVSDRLRVPGRMLVLYPWVGLFVGALIWLLITSVWAYRSKAHESALGARGLADSAFLLLHDHHVAVTAGAGVLIVLAGEFTRLKLVRRPGLTDS